MGSLGAVRFDVKSVNVNDVAKGGNGSVQVGRNANKPAGFAGQSTVDQTILEQTPEPPRHLRRSSHRSRLGGLTRVCHESRRVTCPLPHIPPSLLPPDPIVGNREVPTS